MKLVTYNIQFGRGKDGRTDIDRIASELEGADLIALQEVDRFWARSGDVDQVAAFADRFPNHHWVYGAGVDTDADRIRADGSVEHRRRQFGNMLLSRFPIRASRNHLLPKYGSTGPLSVQRSALEGIIEFPEVSVRAYSIHLTHLSSATRLPQVEALLAIHDNAVREGAPVSGNPEGGYWAQQGLDVDVPLTAMMFGDFNLEPDSPEFERMVGPMSVYGGRISNPAGFIDAWEHLHEGELGATSDVNDRPARLDYCFLSTALAPRLRDAWVDTEAVGSDHQPVWIHVDL